MSGVSDEAWEAAVTLVTRALDGLTVAACLDNNAVDRAIADALIAAGWSPPPADTLTPAQPDEAEAVDGR